MTRIVGKDGVVHFRNPAEPSKTLCGEWAHKLNVDLLGSHTEVWTETTAPVTCPKCARVYCAVKNELWNAVEDGAMDVGIMDAVKPDGEVSK